MLILKRAAKHRPGGRWHDDDYDVFDGERHVGRILRHPAGAEGAAVVLDHHRAR